MPNATNDGFVSYEEPNAINFVMNSEAASVITNFNTSFNTRKVILLAAYIKPIRDIASGTSRTRVAIGTFGSAALGDSAVLSVSFANTQHTRFETTGNGVPDDGNTVNIAPSTSKAILDFVNPKIIYVVWNGLGSSATVVGTLFSKCLNADSSVYNGDGFDCIQTTTGIITSDIFIPGNMMRPAWAHYYKIEAHELDALPTDLDYKLSLWGNATRNGHKGAMVL